jgi:hypothetical protein
LSAATTKDYFLSIAAAGMLYQGLGGEGDFEGEDLDEATASLEVGTFTDYGDDLSDEFGGCNSFIGSTRVLLADKKTVSISKIKAGAEVIAGNPPHGKPAAELVVRFIITRTDRNFTTLEVKTPSGTARIVSTAYHRYWDATVGQWTYADALRTGDRLLALNGEPVTVTSVRNYIGHAVTYNLTVNRLHTYYVMAGKTPVLVHNTACSAQDLAEAFRDATVGKKKNVAALTYDIDGVEGNAVTVSGTAVRNGAVGMPQDPVFETTRDAEAEWKLLEYLDKKLTPGATGTIDLYTERTPCASCQEVIKQFKQKYPGVTIHVSTGT